MDKALTKLTKARTQLLLNKRYTFWATIGLYQILIENNGPENPTMATDGEHLYYNKEFVEMLPNNELMFVLAHEAGHCALGHHLRRQTRDRFAWNVAADFALNLILEETGLTKPKTRVKDKTHKASCPNKDCKGKLVWGTDDIGVCANPACSPILLDHQFKGMSTELIFSKIPQKNITGMKGSDFRSQSTDFVGDIGGCGSVMDSALSKKEGEEGIKKWEIITRQAAQLAKSQGYLPGNFEYLVEPLKPKVDFQSMLRHLISVAQEDDYSWARPNKRHVWNELYLPSLRTESMGDIVIAIDISGSISKDQAARFCGAVNIILSEVKPKNLHFIQCDAAIQSHEVFQKGELLPEKVKIKGGGGTDMRPIWAHIEEKGLQPVCAIVCSDFEMSTDSFGKKQDFPVLWVTCTKQAQAPWGITVNLD